MEDVNELCAIPSLRALDLNLSMIHGRPTLWPAVSHLTSLALKLQHVDLGGFDVGPAPALRHLALDLVGCAFNSTLAVWLCATAPQLTDGLSLTVEADENHLVLLAAACAAAPAEAPISLGMQCFGHIGCATSVHRLLQSARPQYHRLWIDDGWQGLVLPLPPLRVAELWLPSLPWHAGARLLVYPTVVSSSIRVGMTKQSSCGVVEHALLRALASPWPHKVEIEMANNPRLSEAAVSKFLQKIWVHTSWHVILRNAEWFPRSWPGLMLDLTEEGERKRARDGGVDLRAAPRRRLCLHPRPAPERAVPFRSRFEHMEHARLQIEWEP